MAAGVLNESSDRAARAVLLVFIDGVGLGEPDPAVNALADHAPFMTALLGGGAPTAAVAPAVSERASLVALDATLGAAGLPQSGTGQAALLTGTDAVALHGRHFGPWVPTRLRPLVREQSILARAKRAGRTVAFANAYPEELVAAAAQPRSRNRRLPHFLRAGPPLAALGAGVLDRHTAALERGDAVASEIVNDGWRERLGRSTVPPIEAAAAGRNLAHIAAQNDLTLFAHYSTDTVGHLRSLDAAREAIRRVDAFLEGVLAALPAHVLLVIASDHGNLEDCRAGHTRNPALLVAAGPKHRAFVAGLAALTDIAPAIGRALGCADWRAAATPSAG